MPRNQNQRLRATYACSFCGKDQDHVRRLIAGPGGVYICDECVTRIANETDDERGESAERCSFCGKKQAQIRYIKQGPGQISICNECIELCQEIIEAQESTIPKPAKPVSDEKDNNSR